MWIKCNFVKCNSYRVKIYSIEPIERRHTRCNKDCFKKSNSKKQSKQQEI